MIDLIGLRRYGYILSSVVVGTCLVFILATLIPNGNVGLQFSIAYTGGTVWEVHFEDGAPAPADVRTVLEEQGLNGEVAITEAGDRAYVLIRTEALALQEPELAAGSAAAAALAAQAGPSPQATGDAAVPATPAGSDAVTATTEPDAIEAPAGSIGPAASADAQASGSPAISPDPVASASPAPSASPLTSLGPEASPGPDGSPIPAGAGASGGAPNLPTDGQFGELAAALQEQFGAIDEVRQQNSVGPVVSQELIWQTFMLVLMASVAIMLWVAYRFRDFRMGVTALVALLHDVIVVLGAFAILGTFIGLQIDALFVTAMLTVIGFSVHDTIVVFDRVRENRQRYLGEPLQSIVNHSLVQTIGRSLTTSLTLVLTLLALLLFGGEAIRPFTVALLVGVIAGTYSSLFVATPLFLDWHRWADRRKAQRATGVKVDTSAA